MEIDANRTEKEAFVMLEQLGKQAKEASSNSWKSRD